MVVVQTACSALNSIIHRYEQWKPSRSRTPFRAHACFEPKYCRVISIVFISLPLSLHTSSTGLNKGAGQDSRQDRKNGTRHMELSLHLEHIVDETGSFVKQTCKVGQPCASSTTVSSRSLLLHYFPTPSLASARFHGLNSCLFCYLPHRGNEAACLSHLFRSIAACVHQQRPPD